MDVLHRQTLEYRTSVNTLAYPPEEWVHGPDLAAVAGVPRRHWKLVDDAVVPMSLEEREAVDLPLDRAAKLAAIDAWWDEQAAAGIDVDGGVFLRSGSLDATQLQALLVQLSGAPDETPTLVSDVNGHPVPTTAGAFRALASTYADAFQARRAAWAMAKGQALAATTTAEVAAVEVPHG